MTSEQVLQLTRSLVQVSDGVRKLAERVLATTKDNIRLSQELGQQQDRMNELEVRIKVLENIVEEQRGEK